MPPALMPATSSASPPTIGSAKKTSLLTECAAGVSTRQHSRLLNNTSAWRSSSMSRENGALGSVTFMRFTSPVRIIRNDIVLPHDADEQPTRLSPHMGGLAH